MNWKFLFFSLRGRISRLPWWLGMLTVELIGLGLSILAFWWLGIDLDYYWSEAPATPTISLVEASVFVLTVRASLAVDIKRIHDLGRTAYLLVPVYLADITIIGLQGIGRDPFAFFENEWDLQTGYPWMLLLKICLIIALVLYVLWMLFILGFRKGTKGPSKYGPDPLEALTEPIDETI